MRLTSSSGSTQCIPQSAALAVPANVPTNRRFTFPFGPGVNNPLEEGERNSSQLPDAYYQSSLAVAPDFLNSLKPFSTTLPTVLVSTPPQLSTVSSDRSDYSPYYDTANIVLDNLPAISVSPTCTYITSTNIFNASTSIDLTDLPLAPVVTYASPNHSTVEPGPNDLGAAPTKCLSATFPSVFPVSNGAPPVLPHGSTYSVCSSDHSATPRGSLSSIDSLASLGLDVLEVSQSDFTLTQKELRKRFEKMIVTAVDLVIFFGECKR